MPIAVAFFLVSSGVITAFATNEDFREAIYRMIFKEESRYIEITPNKDYEAFIDPELYTWGHCFAPTYMPEGFTHEFTDDDSLMFIVQYSDGSGHYINFRQAMGSVSRIDNERVQEQKKILIGDSVGLLTVTEDGDIILKWQVGERMLTLTTTISKEETVKVAENIKLLR